MRFWPTLIALLLSISASSARAAPSANDCRALPALAELLGAHTTGLASEECKGTKQRLNATQFAQAWRTLAKRGGYQVDVLRRALPSRVAKPTPTATTAAWLKLVVPKLDTLACKALRDRILDGKATVEDKACGGTVPGLQLEGARGGRAVDGALLAIEVSEPAREVTVISPLGQHEIVFLQRPNGARLGLVIVPKKQTATIAFSGGTPPRHYATCFPEQDVCDAAASDSTSSVDVRAYGKISDQVDVIVDGQLIASSVPREETFDITGHVSQGTLPHGLVVADHATGMPRDVKEFSPKDVAQTGGVSRELDLSGDGIVALLQAQADETCTTNGLDMGAVESATSATIRSFLGNAKYQDIRDDVVAREVTEGIDRALAPSQNSADPVPAPERRLDKSSADVSNVVRSVSDLLNGRGYGYGLILHISCSASPTQPSFTFSFSRINTRNAWRAVISKRYENFIETESETVDRRDELLNGLRSPLLRLFKRPTARFSAPPGHPFYESNPTVTATIELPEAPSLAHRYELELAIARTDSKVASVSCRSIERAARLATSGLRLGDSIAGNYRDASWLKAGSTTGCLFASDQAVGCIQLEDGRQTQEVSLPFLPDTPGEYLLEVRLRSGRGEPLARARRCARVERAAPRIATLAYFGVEPSTADAAFLVGSWLFSESSDEAMLTAELGGVVAYGYLTHEREQPPDWRDIARTTAGLDDGQLELRWARHALLLGPTARIAVPLWGTTVPRGTSRRLALVGQVAPLLDLGFIDVSRIPEQLREFRTTTSDIAFEVDGSAIVQLAVRWRYNEHAEFQGGAWAGWFGIDDVVGDDSVGVSYDSRTYVGLTFGWGYEL